MPIPALSHHHLVHCKGCGFVYTGWEPTEAELVDYYAQYPAPSAISPVTLKRYDELLQKFAPYRKTGSLFEVGCGAGHFLERAMGQGWSVHGNEYGNLTIASCRGRNIAVTEGPLDPARHGIGTFDVVCSFEVIEHVAHPRREIDHMLALLRPGGLLYLTTPNFNCLARRVSPREWSVASYPEHLNYFTPASLHHMLRGQGARKRWLTTTGISVERWRTKLSKDPAKRSAARAEQEALRNKMETVPTMQLFKKLANGFLDITGSGDSMKAGYEKIPDQVAFGDEGSSNTNGRSA